MSAKPSVLFVWVHNWTLDDPAGQGVEAVRPIRDEIKARVERLIAELLP